jgi:hypothetical protein
MLSVCGVDCGRAPHPIPLPASGERDRPAQREGEGQRRTRRDGGFPRLFFAAAVVGLVLVAAAIRPAGAQQTVVLPGTMAEPTQLPGGVEFIAAPYLWAPGLHMTVTTPIPRASSVNIDLSPLQVLGDLDAVPFMGSIEIRDGPLGLLGDAFHGPLAAGFSTRNIFYNGGQANIVADFGTALLLYRFVNAPTQYADLGLGFRPWGFTVNVNLHPGLLPGASSNQAASWVDPLIGGRYHVDFPAGFFGSLPSGFGFSAYGDVGGFDLGAHTDWQLIGTIDYAPNPWLNLHVGYRSLNFDYTASRFAIGFNTHMRGPILAATIKF